VVLAAGEGRRFGGPKQVALWQGRPLLSWVLDAVRGVPAVDPAVLVLGAHASVVRAVVDLRGFEVVEAEDWAEGQAASLRAGVSALDGRVGAAVVLLGDTPGMTSPVIAGALDHLGPEVDAVRTLHHGQPGHPVVLGSSLLARVTELRGDIGARALMDAARVRSWEAGHLCDATDIDTPEQLESG
jgi:molybdenum cofactor cytidylyltransferase